MFSKLSDKQYPEKGQLNKKEGQLMFTCGTVTYNTQSKQSTLIP